MSIISIDEFDIQKIESDFEVKEVHKSQQRANIQTTLVVMKENKLLFEYDYVGKISNQNEDFKDELEQILRIAGFYDMTFEFTPNNSIYFKDDTNFYYFDTSTVQKKTETFNAYEAWFKNLFSSFNNPIILVADTNFLKNCYYSNYFKKIIDENKHKVSIAISRLSLLEIEYQINRATKDIKSNEKRLENKPDDQSIKSLLQGFEREKRLGFQAMGEIVELTRNGTKILPYYDSLVKSFDKASGSSLADAWIRREINEYTEQIKKGPPTGLSGVPSVIFLTGDLLNALMSAAENINTIYVHNLKKPRYRNKDINKLVYTTSVLFESCDLVIKGNYTSNEFKCTLTSIWEGKSLEDWSDRKIEVQIY